MKTALKEIKKELESTLEGFKDAYEYYGYDLANERHFVETALKKVNLLLLHKGKFENMAEEIIKNIAVLPPVMPRFEEVENEEDNEDKEPNYHICMCCGHVQKSGISCNKCAGPVKEEYY